MGWVLTIGMSIVLFFQALGDWLVEPMRLLSQLGTETFFLLAMPALLWCVDAAWGVRVAFALSVSASLNHSLKLVFLGPRPYWISAEVEPLSAETSLGAPSGHAQNAMAVWGMAAVGAGRHWVRIGAITLVILIGLSRIYLGMHFPHDVLLGWLFGALIVGGLLRGEAALKPWLQRRSSPQIILASFGASLALILLTVVILEFIEGWMLPAAWITLAARSGVVPDPLKFTGVVSTAAVFFGTATGAVLLHARGWYDARGDGPRLAARYLLGLAGLLGLYVGLDMIFPDGVDLTALAFRYIRYASLGIWVAFLAPELFIRFGLARRDQPVEGSRLIEDSG